MTPTAATVKYRKNYQASQYLIKKTQLLFQLFDDHTLVTAILDISRNPLDHRSQLEPLVLDGVELELVELSIDEKKLAETEYKVDAQHLTLVPAKENFILTSKVKILPHKNTSLSGLYLSNNKFCTQCEAEGFRRITYYLDRPDVMSEFFVRIEANKKQYPLLLSNGNPIAKGEVDQQRHFAQWHDPFAKPSYLFALVAGDLDCLEDHFTTHSGKKVTLQLFVDKGKLDQCRFAMDSLIAAMRWDEKRFALEYDLDLYMIVAVGDFNMGAMENKGLNIFNTACVLANVKTATDADFESIERVIAHEYFHNWTGNRVTCRDWFQLSLKEGLTVFRDQQFSEDVRSKAVQRIKQVKTIRSAQFAEDSGPMAHPVRPDSYIEMNNFYTTTVYDKGAEVIRMMHSLLGEQGFRAGMDLYFKRHDGSAVTCEDFIQSMEDANDKQWSQFRRWYSQAGTPQLQVSLQQINPREVVLHCQQSCPPTPGQQNKQPFMLPIKLGFISAEGKVLKFTSRQNQNKDSLEEMLIVMTEAKESFHFDFAEDCNQKIIPSLLKNFSAPIKLAYDYSLDDLAMLFANDPDEFNRWDAGQTLLTRILTAEEAVISAASLEIIDNAFVKLLNDASIDNQLKSLAIQPPALSSLIGQLDAINLDQLFAKYRQLKQHLANKHQQLWATIYQNTDNKTAENRSLRNTALNYLMQASSQKYLQLAESQLIQSDNMNDELAALAIIAKSDCYKNSNAINHFYEKWQNEALVMDKWFSAQVMRDDEKVIDTVIQLTQHEKFSYTNPNKVRALIGSFVAGNLMQFHSATGRGYQLLADNIIKLDAINPQIASRLAKQFNQWKKFDNKRQALIKEQMERIKIMQGISDDVFEVIDKSLQS